MHWVQRLEPRGQQLRLLARRLRGGLPLRLHLSRTGRVPTVASSSRQQPTSTTTFCEFILPYASVRMDVAAAVLLVRHRCGDGRLPVPPQTFVPGVAISMVKHHIAC